MKKTTLLLVSMSAALLLASMVALVATENTARAAFPGINGKIVFTRDPDGYQGPKDSEIFTIGFDGNNLKRLTNNSTKDVDPAWSADGKKIAFSHGLRFHQDIFVMNANGSNKTLITDERKIPGTQTAEDFDPAFSPNGRWIVFVRGRDHFNVGGDISKIKADGTDLTYLQSGGLREQSPSWSPDGTRIAYSDRGDPYDSTEYVITIRPDGSGYRNLTDGRTPDWSPDSSRIVFAYGGGICTGICTMAANGSGEKPLMTNIGGLDPAFSPGGGKIVFSGDRDGDLDLYIMDADGTDVRPLTDLPGDERSPDWRPVQ
jgi:TolB protein